MSADPAPLFAVVRGAPTDEELAAVTVALLSQFGPTDTRSDPSTPPPGWSVDGYHAPGAWARQ